LETLDLFLKYIVVPVVAFVYMLHSKLQAHHTDIEVLKATAAANKEAHDREFKQLQESFKAVFTKLDGIEEALRK
jgi:hypothetical protein